jgi:hypothetical protein
MDHKYSYYVIQIKKQYLEGIFLPPGSMHSFFSIIRNQILNDYKINQDFSYKKIKLNGNLIQFFIDELQTVFKR